MNRYTEDMKLWLFDLAHGNLDDSHILSGFIKYYVLFDCTIADIQRDIVFHTSYGDDGVSLAVNTVRRVLQEAI